MEHSPYNNRSHAEDGLQDVRGTSVLQRPERRPWTHWRLPRNNRSLAEDGLQDVRGMSVLRRPKRSGDRVRSGRSHATSRRRDLEPWAPAPQQSEPCGRWVARRPGDVCSATTEAERRPWTHGDKVRFRF